MYPDLIWAIVNDRERERLAHAEATRRARAVRAAKKARRRARIPAEVLHVRIPDYVDGSFREAGTPEDSSARGGSAASGPGGGDTAECHTGVAS